MYQLLKSQLCNNLSFVGKMRMLLPFLSSLLGTERAVIYMQRANRLDFQSDTTGSYAKVEVVYVGKRDRCCLQRCDQEASSSFKWKTEVNHGCGLPPPSLR